MGASAARRLKEGRVGVVQSVFSRAVNILAGDGIVCLVARGVGRGPVNVVLGSDAEVGLDALGLSAGMPVSRVEDELIIGGVVSVVLASSETYLPTPPEGALRTTDKARVNLEALKAIILSRGNPAGLGSLVPWLDGGSSETAPPMSQSAAAALAPLGDLVRALQGRRLGPVAGAARKLIGLGPGLTPAADDTLAGLMIALLLTARAVGRGGAFAAAANGRISSAIEGRTTMLSREFLLHAAKGLGNEHISDLAELVLFGTVDEVERASLLLLETGATSGTDTALGVFLGVKAGIRMKERPSR